MGLSEIHERISCMGRKVPALEIAMLNRAIIAAFLATSAAAFGISSAAAGSGQSGSPRSAPERVECPAARPLGTVDTPLPSEERREPPRTVRA